MATRPRNRTNVGTGAEGVTPRLLIVDDGLRYAHLSYALKPQVKRAFARLEP